MASKIELEYPTNFVVTRQF